MRCEFVTESAPVKQLSTDKRGEASIAIESHDGDLSKRIGLNVEVHGPRAEPFVESPLFGGVQMESKISSILLCPMFLRLMECFIITTFPVGTDAGDGGSRQKILPSSNARLPPPSFGSPAHAREETKGRLDHIRQP